MELSLGVKSSVQASTKTPVLYEEKILVAIDVTLQKIQKLLMITPLCLYLSEDPQKFTSSRRKKLERLEAVLGKEASDLLGELVSCQKKLSDYNLPPHLRKTTSTSDDKAELIRRLKANPEKKQFLLDVFKATKSFLLSMNNVSVKDAVSQKEEDPPEISHPSLASTEISLFGEVETHDNNETKKSPMSALKLLRDAFHSKYKRHVRRSFKELDLESLLSILYLTYEDSTKNVVSPEMRSQFFSSFSYNENEDECLNFDLDYEADETEESDNMNDYLRWEVEEMSPFLFDTQPSTCGEAFSYFEESNSVMENHEKTEFFGPSILEEASSFDYEQNGTHTHRPKSEIPFPPKPSLPDHAKEVGVRVQDSPFEISCQIINLQIALLEHPLTLTFKESLSILREERNVDVTTQLNNLLEYFAQFRCIAQTILEDGGNSSWSLGYSRNLIDYKLKLIKMQKLESVYCKNLAHKEEQSRGLDDAILRWNYNIEKATEEAITSIKVYIKEKVASQTIHKKQSQIDVSKIKAALRSVNGSLSETVDFVKSSTKSLRARRHYLEASLDALIRHYESTMQKYQVKLDELQVIEEVNKKATEKLQKKFKHVEETYDEMRAMRRLKELLQNMQKAEAIKQNWAARKIQMQWRKYKLAKLRKKKLKGKKKGKKKTPPPPGKGSTTASPSKGSTPASRSRSKSQTP